MKRLRILPNLQIYTWWALVLVAASCNIGVKTNPHDEAGSGVYTPTATNPIENSRASWVSPVSERHGEYGIFMFRNSFELDAIPETLKLHVSADNRYKLYINETLVGHGPARGNLENWYYETYDIKEHLLEGVNTIAAEVMNFGPNRPLAQITRQTAFWLETEDTRFAHLNTGSGHWTVKINEAYQPIPFGPSLFGEYYVCGPGDEIDFSKFASDWVKASFDDAHWQGPYHIPQQEKDTLWRLIPRDIPFMENREDKVDRIVRASGLALSQWQEYPGKEIVVPPNTEASLLFDAGELTVGYPRLHYSGGKDGHIKITYAESLFDDNGIKGDRNAIEGKEIIGYHDLLKPNGKKDQIFEPLWLRTFRYLQLDISTKEEELLIGNLNNLFHAYPLTLNSEFKSSKKIYDRFNSVGWHTLRLCAGETYFDCPYYEQLQYIGDTRVQALITLYLSEDDRLVKKAIRQFHQTSLPEGLTHSRGPAYRKQVIPGFSLYWISMLYDYLMLRDGQEFVAQYLEGIDSMLNYFSPFVSEKNMLGHLAHGDTVGGGLPEYWYFTDWSDDFYRGMPQGVYDNHSSVITLHYANTLLQASEIVSRFEMQERAVAYRQLAKTLIQGTVSACYDEQKGLLAQTPDKQLFSQHANILAILTDAFPQDQQKEVMEKILNDQSLIRCSMYFRFYLFEALKKLDMDHEIPAMFDFWEQALDMGLTTFPEKEGNPRSDCHAWNSSPMYIFLSAFAGIESAEPGFKKVRISPYLDEMDYLTASVPHPDGKITVDFKKTGTGITGEVILPEGIKGVFEHAKVKIELDGGLNKIDLR